MKFSLKTLAAAAVMAVAASGANAAIDNGAGGNGELFFNIWDANGSYTRSLEVSIDSFQSQLGAVGNLNLSWSADVAFTSFLSGADVASLKWNVLATDTAGARRLLSTYTAPEPATAKTNDVIRSAALATQTFVTKANDAMGAADSVVVNNGSAAWAGKAAFGENVGGLLNFSNAGTIANNSFNNGLGLMRIDGLATGILKSNYNEYLEGTTAVNVWLDGDKTLHIGAIAAAVPEPESYAMLLAGLGMIGLMARRRQNRA